ncbi:unnamed protein product [Trichobilharzia regenti]|nr:unnamed protein product [Trichobilharzia regenti]
MSTGTTVDLSYSLSVHMAWCQGIERLIQTGRLGKGAIGVRITLLVVVAVVVFISFIGLFYYTLTLNFMCNFEVLICKERSD